MTKQKTRVTKLVVLPEGESIFSEAATTVQIQDLAAGEFVEVSQTCGDLGKIWINPEEWPALRAAINRLIRQCEDAE